VAASVTAAAIFYRYVELPSQRLSSSIRYRGGREAPSPSTVATPAARPADPVTG
jgi:peptidoglycan/LPS O-acetylase OafA/YrhL